MNIRKIIGYINCICLIFHDVYRPDYSYLQPHHSGYLPPACRSHPAHYTWCLTHGSMVEEKHIKW